MPNKELRVGLVGCGFMGRAHSNAHRKVWNFFDLEYRPVLKAICDSNEQKAQAHAAKWGFESVETNWQLKNRKSGFKAIAVEPAASPVLSGGKPGAHESRVLGRFCSRCL